MAGNYLQVKINGVEAPIKEADQQAVGISYKLEDQQDFNRKKSTTAFNIHIVPAAAADEIANSAYDPGIEDMTEGEVYKDTQDVSIEAMGVELLRGKGFLVSARHTSRPSGYTYDVYGDNSDWIIDLDEVTLYDLLKHINFTFTKQGIIDSWSFDGRDELLPYVFAPVRYGEPMAEFQSGETLLADYNMKPEYMRPSLSKYWLVYWGFKRAGYKIISDFFDTDFFRRQLMPWTWGNFLYSDGTRLKALGFLAKSAAARHVQDNYDGYVDLNVSNDNAGGAFDDNGVYEYIQANQEMRWTYLNSFDFGNLETTFRLMIDVNSVIRASGTAKALIDWYHNGVLKVDKRQVIIDRSRAGLGRDDHKQIYDFYQSFNIKRGDTISARVHAVAQRGDFVSNVNIVLSVLEFSYQYSRIPLGGAINFDNYSALKNYRFLDFFTGLVDEFNLTFKTDSINKQVLIEPTHDYSLSNDGISDQKGYFNGDHLEWSGLQDLSKESNVQVFRDVEKELVLKYREDNADGIVKTIQDRYNTVVASGKYVFPKRFPAGKKEIENRFFSPVMHYSVEQWRGLGAVGSEAPQMVALVPENISNTSRDEAQNTFAPKSVYYKGIIQNAGWVFDGEVRDSFPFMFAVNYTAGGHLDPVLSYSDELIGEEGSAVVAMGLMRRFFLQRFAIMRNGQYYHTFFRLDAIHITNWFHREHIACMGQKWELTEIKNFNPLKKDSTSVSMSKWVPIAEVDHKSVYPSKENILGLAGITEGHETKYARLLCLPSDIPVPENI